MSTEIQKTETTEVTKTGEAVLGTLRETWGLIEVTREVVKMKDGKPAFVKEVCYVDSPNKRLNQEAVHLLKEEGIDLFNYYASIVGPDDQQRMTDIIKAGSFEVVKAIQSIEAISVAKDNRIKPISWNEADSLKTPYLSTVIKYKGLEKAEALVHMMIVNFSKKYGKRNDLDEHLIKELSMEICAVYSKLTIGDLKFIFANALRLPSKEFNLDYQGVISLLDAGLKNKLSSSSEKTILNHNHGTAYEKSTRFREGNVKKELSGENISIAEQQIQIGLMERHEAEQKNNNTN